MGFRSVFDQVPNLEAGVTHGLLCPKSLGLRSFFRVLIYFRGDLVRWALLGGGGRRVCGSRLVDDLFAGVMSRRRRIGDKLMRGSCL